MNITEMKQNLAKLVKEARAKLDAGDMEGYNNIDSEIDKLQAKINAAEKQNKRETLLDSIPEPTAKPNPANVKPEKKPVATDEYKHAFYNAIRHGLGSLSGDERHTLNNVMSTGADSGGMLVMPEELESAVRALLADQVAMRRLASVISLTADRKIVLAANYGAAEWIAENGAYPKVDDSYDTVTVGSHKLGKIIQVSEELLNDSEFNLANLIATSFARAFASGEEQAFVSGTGTGQPTGVLTAAQNGVTAAASTAVTDDEVLDLFYSLKAGYRTNATFMMSNGAEKAIRKFKDGNGNYIWQPGLTAGQPNVVLGRPVAISDYMPDVAAGKKPIAFGDFSQYTIKDTVGMGMQPLTELYAEHGQVGYKGYERTDGKLVVPEAIKTLTMKAGA